MGLGYRQPWDWPPKGAIAVEPARSAVAPPLAFAFHAAST
jgi:hypothetical protein